MVSTIRYTDSGGVEHHREFAYLGNDLVGRTWKIVNGLQSEDIRFVRPDFLVLQDRSGTNATEREYLWRDGGFGGIGRLLRLEQNGVPTEQLSDGIGNIVAVTDGNGGLLTRYRYSAYGKQLATSGPLSQPLQFSSKYYYADVGLSDFGYRFYGVENRGWISRDPIGVSGGVNLYAYVGNNPLTRIDPTGLDWVYSQSTGQLTHVDGNGNTTNVGTGYAGHGQGVNNPAMQNVPNVGPLPQGTYTINPQQNNTTGSGTQLPASMRLTPDPNNQMFGRGGFIIHGDNAAGNQSASEGCPVLNRNVRNQIGNSGDTVFRVVQ